MPWRHGMQLSVCNGAAMYVSVTAAVGSCEIICWADQPWKKWKLCTQDVPCVIQLARLVKVFKTSRVPRLTMGMVYPISFVVFVMPFQSVNSTPVQWFANLHQHADGAARLLYMKQLPVSSISLNWQALMFSKSCIWMSGRKTSEHHFYSFTYV